MDPARASRFRLSHRATWGTVAVLLVAALAAWPQGTEASSEAPRVASPYMVAFAVSPVSAGGFKVEGLFVRADTLEVLFAPTILLAGGDSATLSSKPEQEGDPAMELTVALDGRGSGNARWSVARDGDVLQRGESALSAMAPERGAPITLSLRDADLREVLASFAKISGSSFLIGADLHGEVTIELAEVPWPQALARVLAPTGYAYRRVGKLVTIFPASGADSR